MSRYLVYRAQTDPPDLDGPDVLRLREAHNRETGEPSWLVCYVEDAPPDPDDESVGGFTEIRLDETPEEAYAEPPTMLTFLEEFRAAHGAEDDPEWRASLIERIRGIRQKHTGEVLTDEQVVQMLNERVDENDPRWDHLDEPTT
jgi:hypothetical protein